MVTRDVEAKKRSGLKEVETKTSLLNQLQANWEKFYIIGWKRKQIIAFVCLV